MLNVSLDSNLDQKCRQIKHNIVNCIIPTVQIITTHMHDKAWGTMFLDHCQNGLQMTGICNSTSTNTKKFTCGRSSMLKTSAEACMLAINAPKRENRQHTLLSSLCFKVTWSFVYIRQKAKNDWQIYIYMLFFQRVNPFSSRVPRIN